VIACEPRFGCSAAYSITQR